jgi:nucleoside-diphosphate-sugar epimerase
MDTGGKIILVTGGTGFIGSRVVSSLVRQGIRVLVFAAHIKAERDAHGTEYCRGDIRDREGLEEAVRGAGGIIHAAAAVSVSTHDPSGFHDVNVSGTRNVLDAAMSAGGIPLVHISSGAAIRFRGEGVLDESSIGPRTEHLTEYGISKVRAEHEVERAAAMGLNTVIVYPTRVFGIGPLGDPNAATKALAMYIGGSLKVLPGGGREHANWGYVDDIGAGVAGALLRGEPGERYILGGENLRLRDVFTAADDILGTHHTCIPIPLASGRVLALLEEWRASLAGTRPRITRSWYDAVFEDTQLSCQKARTRLGYRVTPFRQALENVLLWLASGNAPREGTGTTTFSSSPGGAT